MDIDATLKNIAPELSPALRQHLIEVGEIEHYEKGGLILDYGIQACYLPIILDGNARVMRGDEDDPSKELLLYFLTPGEICPCAAFFDPAQWGNAHHSRSRNACRDIERPYRRIEYDGYKLSGMAHV